MVTNREQEIAIIRATAISETYADTEQAYKLLDPEFTYWCDKGDCSKDEHVSWLANADASEIRNWLDNLVN